LQSVVIENTNSTYVDVISGVPQGSVLGPILFILFINDIVTVCLPNTELKLFADDLKLYSVVKVTNPLTGLDSLQQSLDRIYLWATEWQFTINVSKTNVLTLSNKLRSKATRHYSVNQICLPCKDLTPDLGILMDSCLSFRDHINNIVSKSLQRCGVLFRGFVSRDLSFLRKAFVVYVRPILEYNSCIWNPSHKHLIDSIEAVQRRFTKRIPSLSSLSYSERLASINLESLELRRLRFDLIMYYKIINNLTPLCCEQYFHFYSPPASSRTASSILLLKPISGSAKYFSSFFNRSIDCWNSLNPSIRSADSLFKFKTLLSSVDLTKFLIGDVFSSS
jgi:ribonuclease P/MRP protein subunit RPP40